MVPSFELLYPAADSEDNTGVLMTNHVTCSRPFLMSSVNFFATRLAIAGIKKAKRSENQVPPVFGPEPWGSTMQITTAQS
jgi:hypothetical protein